MEFLHWGLVFWLYCWLEHWSDERTHTVYCISTHIQTHVDALRWGECWDVDMNGLGLQCFMLRSCCHAAVIYCFSPIFVVDEWMSSPPGKKLCSPQYFEERWTFTDATYCLVAKRPFTYKMAIWWMLSSKKKLLVPIWRD